VKCSPLWRFGTCDSDAKTQPCLLFGDGSSLLWFRGVALEPCTSEFGFEGLHGARWDAFRAFASQFGMVARLVAIPEKRLNDF